ncbi:hypothetical protein GCM10007049_30930 [Echinicola pacifica]|uniref:Uncharacterized protein n=1 Tax=Echinicola pacifica TaxID=346377 RepID=A0A918UUP0_9BACT|nr:hypothetical protein [Echinicola pacifica]GGZ35320.1 hypothetical protein GCM10007049_30930 [Echinicola pacifica]
MTEIEALSDKIVYRAIREALNAPIDRFFLEKYLHEILELDSEKFLLYNLENVNNTYSVRLLACLPELWENIGFEEMKKLIDSFTNVFSFYAFVQFTYKYLQVDIFEMIYENENVKLSFKKEISEYLINQCANLIMDEDDYFEFEEGQIGVNFQEWNYIKQKLLLDSRIKPATKSLNELYIRLKFYNERYNEGDKTPH